MTNTKAIVTLAIGSHATTWKNICKTNWETYAKRYGYDLICLDHALDTSIRALKRSPAWQKCLILSQSWSNQYDQLVWIDADILINLSTAPSIVEGVPFNKVGAVDQYSIPTPETYPHALNRLFYYWKQPEVVNLTPQKYYENWGLLPKFNQVVQTGVMVMSPRYHKSIFEKVYYEYEEQAENGYEMRPLSYNLLENNVIYWLDNRFNALASIHMALYYPFLLTDSLTIDISTQRLCLNSIFINNYFMHFAGGIDITLVNPHITLFKDFFTDGN